MPLSCGYAPLRIVQCGLVASLPLMIRYGDHCDRLTFGCMQPCLPALDLRRDSGQRWCWWCQIVVYAVVSLLLETGLLSVNFPLS